MNKQKYWILTIIICISFLSIASILPHDPYLRYKSLTVGSYSKAKWIYERAVFDKLPIDIAFIGTSHTLNAVDSVIVENSINTTKQPFKHVVNFAIPHFGRDMHKLLIKLLTENKSPAVILIEIRESEERDQHPATHYLADGSDLISAPLLINLRYFGNLIRLPLRQSRLFLETNFPHFFGVSVDFNEEDYIGSHLNYTTQFPDGKIRSNRNTKNELEQSLSEWKNKNAFKLVRGNDVMDFIYFNANWLNLKNMIELARTKGIKVYFTYLPNYGAQSKPIDASIYEKMAPILYIKNSNIFNNPKYWADLGHLNGDGAIEYSAEISKVLIDELQLKK